MQEKTHCIFLVYTQVYENKGWPDSQDWRPKFGQEFSLKINYSDQKNYGIMDPNAYSEFLESIFRKLLASHNSDLYLYEYMSHDVWFGNPVKLDKKRFYKLLHNQIQNFLGDNKCQ